MRLHGSITQLHYPLRSDTTNFFLKYKGWEEERHKRLHLLLQVVINYFIIGIADIIFQF